MEQSLLKQRPMSKCQILCMLGAGELEGHREQGSYLKKNGNTKTKTELGTLYKTHCHVKKKETRLNFP